MVDGVRVRDVAVAVGEHPLLCVVDPDCGELGLLKGLPAGEHGHGGGVESDVATGGLGLAAGLVDFVADGDESAAERESLSGEVDVGPLETDEFVASHAGVGPKHRIGK